MDLEDIKRGLRAEIKKRENETYATFQCNVRQMCKDVLAKLEEQESEIAELKAEIKRKETVGQRWFERCMEARTENVGLERAIWLARAERYKMKEFIAREEGNLSNQMSWSRVLRERTYNQWVDQLLRIANLANKLQNKCRAKAEKFKEDDK